MTLQQLSVVGRLINGNTSMSVLESLYRDDSMSEDHGLTVSAGDLETLQMRPARVVDGELVCHWFMDLTHVSAGPLSCMLSQPRHGFVNGVESE